MKLFRVWGDDENDCEFVEYMTAGSKENLMELLLLISEEEGLYNIDIEELGDV